VSVHGKIKQIASVLTQTFSFQNVAPQPVRPKKSVAAVLLKTIALNTP
jgi:hypothetical protein